MRVRRLATLQGFVDAGRAVVTHIGHWFTGSRGKGRWSGRGGGGRAVQVRQAKRRSARKAAETRRRKLKESTLKPRRPIPDPKPRPRG